MTFESWNASSLMRWTVPRSTFSSPASTETGRSAMSKAAARRAAIERDAVMEPSPVRRETTTIRRLGRSARDPLLVVADEDHVLARVAVGEQDVLRVLGPDELADRPRRELGQQPRLTLAGPDDPESFLLADVSDHGDPLPVGRPRGP